METFTDCPVRSYRRHTVLAVVFASLDGANPCPLSNATVRRMLLFRLTAAALSTVGGRNHEGTLRRPRTSHTGFLLFRVGHQRVRPRKVQK